MVASRRVCSRLLCALIAGVLAACLAGAQASADSYGQLARFALHAAPFQLTEGTDAFGVDASDDSVYVGEETPETSRGKPKGEYRIQRFSGGGALEATTGLLAPKNKEPLGIEGVAVDPERERIYVLALFERGKGANVPDAEEAAAGTLYAFNSKTLESAVPGVGTPEKEGVLDTPAELEAESNAAGEALLQPSGIAVDQATHEIVIAGEVDEGANSGGRHMALQRVSDEGALGSRYVDPAQAGELEETNSPVVAPSGAVYMLRRSAGAAGAQMIEIPASFASSAEPTIAFQFNSDSERGPLQELVEFDPEGELPA